MPHTIVLDDVPDPIFQGLLREAEARQLTLSGTVLSLLQPLIPAQRVPLGERLASIRETRALLAGHTFSAADIEAFKRESWT